MKRFLIAVGGAAVLAGGALGVSYAQSAPTTPTPSTSQAQSAARQRHDAIIADAASQLGLTTDQLQQALNQARKDLGGSGAHPLAKIRQHEMQVAAKTIGLADVKALRHELAGSTLTDVAQNHGVQPSAVQTAITNDLDAKIQSLANAGTIKSDRVSALDQKVSTRVAALMTHQFPAAKAHS